MIPAMSARSVTVFDTAIGACALVWGEAGIVGAIKMTSLAMRAGQTN
jgi:hypothetical protein